MDFVKVVMKYTIGGLLRVINDFDERVFGSRYTMRKWPWWLLVIFLFIISMAYEIATNAEYNEAMRFILPGLGVTIRVTIMGFLISMLFGLLAGLGRISHNVFLRNIAVTYIEFIRGVPILVLIMTVALVIVPDVSQSLDIATRDIPQEWRVTLALALIYGAFLAEVFRAGIESVEKGQMEAARSLGMSHGQAMYHIILPQAIRNILPALGNNFISMLKDSSLVSVLAVTDLTYKARIYSGSSFRFRESYYILTFFYLSMTVILSLILQWYEKKINQDNH